MRCRGRNRLRGLLWTCLLRWLCTRLHRRLWDQWRFDRRHRYIRWGRRSNRVLLGAELHGVVVCRCVILLTAIFPPGIVFAPLAGGSGRCVETTAKTTVKTTERIEPAVVDSAVKAVSARRAAAIQHLQRVGGGFLTEETVNVAAQGIRAIGRCQVSPLATLVFLPTRAWLEPTIQLPGFLVALHFCRRGRTERGAVGTVEKVCPSQSLRQLTVGLGLANGDLELVIPKTDDITIVQRCAIAFAQGIGRLIVVGAVGALVHQKIPVVGKGNFTVAG